MGTAEIFSQFIENLKVKKIATVRTRYKEITKRVNKDSWNTDSDTYHSLYVGSYGRGTATDVTSDVDVLVELPYSIYQQYDAYSSNGQSALLQAVKRSIGITYSQTDLGGDGQVVVAPFHDMRFEILPAFVNNDKSYTFPDSNNGGTWKVCNPRAEIAAIQASDTKYNGKIRHLTKMMKAWKFKNSVPISGLLIETLAQQFMESWHYNDKSYLYYDWMVRDFLYFLSQQDRNQSWWRARGSGQYVYRTGVFEVKAKAGYENVAAALEAEKNGYTYTAGNSWKNVFGSYFP